VGFKVLLGNRWTEGHEALCLPLSSSLTCRNLHDMHCSCETRTSSTVRAWVAGEAILAHDPTSNPCRRVEIGTSLSGCEMDASKIGDFLHINVHIVRMFNHRPAGFNLR
jgi:hypothetical protein